MLKKSYLFIIVLCLIGSVNIYAQDKFTPKGDLIGRIYANFHAGLTDEVSEDKAIAVERVYLGYAYDLSEEFYAKVLLDIGSAKDLGEDSDIKRYAYFRNALLRYRGIEDLTINFGITPQFQFKFSENYWGHRYIDKSYQDVYKFGYTADLGLTATLKKERYTLDISITNGEGYKSLQSDDHFQYSIGINYPIVESLITRVYYDYQTGDVVPEQSFHWMLGYKYKKKLVAAVEYNRKYDETDVIGQDRYGYCATASYNFTDKWQIFGRYDKLNSSTLEGESDPWNFESDGAAIYSGVQFSPMKAIALSINHRNWNPCADHLPTESYIYFNMGVDF